VPLRVDGAHTRPSRWYNHPVIAPSSGQQTPAAASEATTYSAMIPDRTLLCSRYSGDEPSGPWWSYRGSQQDRHGVVIDWDLSISSGDGQDAEGGEHHRCRNADRSDRQPLGNPAPNEHSWNIGQHHAESGTDDHPIELLEPCGESDRRDLRFITDFRDEKSAERRAERPERLMARSPASYLSGNSAHTATLRNESPSIHRIPGPLSTSPKKVPAKPAAAWLATVAKKIPKMIGTGRRKRAASIKERICVLSPISARPTTMVDTKKASTRVLSGLGGR
jgi:hypothetical protein